MRKLDPCLQKIPVSAFYNDARTVTQHSGLAELDDHPDTPVLEVQPGVVRKSLWVRQLNQLHELRVQPRTLGSSTIMSGRACEI